MRVPISPPKAHIFKCFWRFSYAMHIPMYTSTLSLSNWIHLPLLCQYNWEWGSKRPREPRLCYHTWNPHSGKTCGFLLSHGTSQPHLPTLCLPAEVPHPHLIFCLYHTSLRSSINLLWILEEGWLVHLNICNDKKLREDAPLLHKCQIVGCMHAYQKCIQV
jgi:hypothetical protein